MARPNRLRLLSLLLVAMLPACTTSPMREMPLSLESMGVFHVGGVQVDSPYADARDSAFACSAAIQLGKTSLEQPWSVWGFGPRFGERFADSRFPALPLQQNYIEQFAASFEVFTGPGSMGRAQPGGGAAGTALQALLERIGPAVLIQHSAAGATGFEVARLHPALSLALVSIETTACPALQPDATDPMADVPFLGIYGDYVAERTSGGHPARHAACKAFAESAARRAPGTFIDLPGAMAIRGNSHLMMQDDNSDAIAGMIADWIASVDIGQ